MGAQDKPVQLQAEERPGSDGFDQLVELAQDCLCVCRAGRIVFVNRAGLALFAAESLVGRPLIELVHRDYAEVVAEGLDSLCAELRPLPIKALLDNGTVIDAELTVSRWTGEADCFLVAIRDVSHVRRAAQALHEREERLQGIVDTVGEAIITADERGIIESFNPAATRIFGYPADEAIGRNLAMLMPAPDADAHAGHIANFRRTGESRLLGVGRELLGRRKDGTVFPVEINVAELRHGGERLLIGILRDITERKRIEAAVARAQHELEARVEERTRELRHLSRQNEQILNSANEGIVGLDVKGIVTFANPAAAEMTGWRSGEAIGRKATMILPGIPADPHPGTSETMLWRRDGTCFPVEFAIAPIEEQGELVGRVILLRDITERKKTDEKLRLASAVLETTAEAIMVLDASFRISTVNPAFTAITGFPPSEVVTRPPSFLRNDRSLPETIWEAVRSQGRWDHEQWNKRKSGEDYAERLSITGILDDHGMVLHYIVVFSDITQRKLDEERIRFQANYDGLTGLPNRSLFLDRLIQSLHLAERASQRVGLMFIDLDGFKLVNDTLGHAVGDELLKEAARRLLTCVRNGDTVARLGGDEFTIIMPNLAEVQNAPVVAQRIIDSLEQPFELGGHEAFVSASIGIASFPDDAKDAQDLVKHADAAMYRAKEQGKANYQFFTADLNAQVSERLTLKMGLLKALEREEFKLYYQPKTDLASGRMVGVEALLRWRNPELGMVSPAKFIPVMEESGLIGQVGEWALEVACWQHRAWRDAGFGHMRVAVNLSVRQLRHPDLAKTVEEILVRTGIEPSGLELEITESMIMKDTENAVAVLKSLHDMGIHLAMDDFGTGYSSLSYLKKFPLDTIKIDRSFINDIAFDRDDLEIVRTIITMGHSLRRRIVAEGVETEEQRVLLRKMRCDEIQGYLISPPVPAEAIDAMLAGTVDGVVR